MEAQSMLPAVDRAPLPAPVWLFQVLLLLTFLLHLLPMNFLVGGGVYVLVLRLRGAGIEQAEKLGHVIRKMLPVIVAATVTLGVAPLLFVQVLYGQFFYTSSILIGIFWFLVIPLLIFAYYGFYKESYGGSRLWVYILSVLFVLYIGFMLSYNAQLMADLSGWEAHHEIGGAGKLAFAGEILSGTFFGRWLHMMAGAFTITGIWFFVIGLVKGKGDSGFATFARRKGAQFFLWGMVVSIVTGFWFLFSLPDALRDPLLRPTPAGGLLWMAGVLLSVGAAWHLHQAAHKEGAEWKGTLGIALGLLSLVLMILLRHNLREATLMLTANFSAADLPTSPQWGVLGLFLVVFVIGLGVVYGMLKMVLRKQTA
jgi:hypothetical protein